MDKVILAIDGGATKTVLSLRKSDGTVLFEAKGEGSNYQTSGVDQVKKVLSALLTDVQEAMPLMQVDVAIFALAGIDSAQDERVVRGIVEEVCRLIGLQTVKLIIENDAEATMLGTTGGKPGALLIVGTGSIAFAHDAKGKIVRSGGWGHRAGDEGSGYWMGREVLRAIFKMEDGRGPVTSLKDEVLKTLKLGSVEDVSDWLFGEEYSVERVAKLSIILNRCAGQGDRVAIQIMEASADELALLVESVLHQCDLMDEACTVYLNGGAIVHSKILVRELARRVQRAFPFCELITSTKPPIESIIRRGWLAS